MRPFLLLVTLVLLVTACNSASKRIEELNTTPQTTGSGRPADGVQVRDSGFVWDGETLSYAFTAENMTDDKSMEETVVQVSIYGLSDQPIGSDTGVIDFILPGQVVAYAGRLPLLEEPKRLALAFTVEKQATVQETRAFERVAGQFEETSFGGRVVAAILNPYDRELRRLKVVAVLRGEDGEILNGGDTVLELLPALGESTVTIDVLGSPPTPPARVDVYTLYSAETVYRLQ